MIINNSNNQQRTIHTSLFPKPGTIFQCLSPQNGKSKAIHYIPNDLPSTKIDPSRNKQFQRLLSAYQKDNSTSATKSSTMRKSLNEPSQHSHYRTALQEQIVRLVSSVTPQKHEDRGSGSGNGRYSKLSTEQKEFNMCNSVSSLTTEVYTCNRNFDLQIIYQKVKQKLNRYENEKKKWQEEREQLHTTIRDLQEEVLFLKNFMKLNQNHQKPQDLDQSFG